MILEMGFVWNPIHLESGVDGIIEIRDPSTGETRNRIVQVQVKAVSNFNAEQDDSFSFSCERAHIGYWLGGTARVILVVCKPDTNEIYWKDLHSYFSQPENRERCTVRFAKKTDRFNLTTSSALATLAQPAGGLALGALPKSETLWPNLFPLADYPSVIFETPTKEKERDPFYAGLFALSKPWLREFVWEARVLYSFFDPEAEGISDLCDGTSQQFPTDKWSQADDLVLQNHFAELIKKAFRNWCFKRNVEFDQESKLFYVKAPLDGSELKVSTKSLVNTTPKTIVSKHSSTRKDGTASTYYRHYAFDARMRRFDQQWYVELTPTYRFTTDGILPHPNADILLKGIKRMERHPAVLSLFLTWKEYLTVSSLLEREYEYLRVYPPKALALDRGIEDAAWHPIPVVDEGDVEPELDEDSSSSTNEESDDLFAWTPT